MNNDHPRPQWDQEKADRLIGAVVLVGMTYSEPGGPRLEQFFGTVISAVENIGIMLRLDGSRSGETFNLPPDVTAFFPAKPGIYRLRSTSEEIKDPDYTATWNRYHP
jgi:hypothetical protein